MADRFIVSIQHGFSEGHYSFYADGDFAGDPVLRSWVTLRETASRFDKAEADAALDWALMAWRTGGWSDEYQRPVAERVE